MKVSRLPILLAVSLVMAVTVMVHAAAITKIENNAFDGVSDATYVNKVLTYHTDDVSGFNVLDLYQDGIQMDGYTWNVSLTMSSTFQDYAQTLPQPPRAFFQGGSMNLTFEYSGDEGATWTQHVLSGVITQGSVEITSTSPTLSTMTGVFNFDTAQGAVNLPYGDTWPATGLSTAVALSFAIGADLTPLTQHPELWQEDLIPAQRNFIFDTQFGLFPEQRPIPEPTIGLLFLAGGGLVIVRRRR